jgi:hypothetical protein
MPPRQRVGGHINLPLSFRYNITSNTLYCYIKVNERSEVWEDACLLKGQKSEVMIVATEQIEEAQVELWNDMENMEER